jgi:hypothetical protein
MAEEKVCIPEGIEEVFKELRSEIIWLHVRWIIYRQLFETSERRIDLLNECASVVFYVIEETLIDEMQLCLSKLTDSASSGRNKNLCLEHLCIRIRDAGELKMANSLLGILSKIRVSCKPFRFHRHKRIAHFDLNTSLHKNLLPTVTRKTIEEVLEAIRDFMNVIQSYYYDSEQVYKYYGVMEHGGDKLVGLLKKGLRYEELVRLERIPYGDEMENRWQDA